ncbi:serine hydrolase [Streptomyces sp. 5-8]|uniref:Serine hydrolase n=1 Tax=Streptomyces musisoli TaxID=2802280 RepID=A0ABS1P9G0_9ACTN|nr:MULTISPECIES: serine hydrolase [Streptomyces]MBL1108810.1 serine hydrolase [Streptomyces musisoli]MBY8842938.1 serine hydrolase [Streptomyces sp. SP2-10]
MNPAWQARHGLPLAQYQTEFDTLVRQGFRLLDVNGYSINGADHYATVWEQSPGPPWEAHHGLTSDEHTRLFQTLPAQGFRPVSVSGYDRSGRPRFASLWQKTPGPAFEARHGMTADQYQAAIDDCTARGFRPVDLSCYSDGGQVRFAAVWDQSPVPAWAARHGMTTAEYQAEFTRLAAQGYVLLRVTGYEVSGSTRYAAIWVKGRVVTWQARHGLSSTEYQSAFNDLLRRGYRLTKINGHTAGGRTSYAGIWHKPYLSDDDETFIRQTVTTFMSGHGIPGASVALADSGRLVFARGYGVVDPATGAPVTTGHVFRIASVSKPITAVAVFRLIEQGRLRLNDRVFGANGILGTTYATPPYSTNIDQITVQNLLEHTSGWAGSQDPMFRHLDLSQHQLIDWMLGRDTTGAFNAPLSHTPGTTIEYLNFGYCLLGRVIERITGLPYEAAVRRLVLEPCGIIDMHVAGDTLADRRGNEVVYTPQGTPGPYGIRVSRMDAHGGWLASPTDLLRFLTRVDGFPEKPDILSAGSLTTMYTPTTARTPSGDPSGYAKGWATNAAGNHWHDGDLPGTASILVRTSGHQGWAVVVNSRDDTRLDTMRKDLDDVMWSVVQHITDWPAHDLF